MDPLSIAALAASGVKAVGGLIQGIGGARKQRNLWNTRPQLGVTAGETANDNLYNQMASATEMPGQRQFEDKLGQTYAEGVYDTQKGAISSLGATQGAVDLAGKKMQAVQDLAGQFAEYKAKRMDALGQWNNQKTNLETQRFDVNKMQPWGAKMNEAVSQKQQGFASAMGGLDSGLSTLSDIQGTQKYMDLYKSLYPNMGSSNSGGSDSWMGKDKAFLDGLNNSYGDPRNIIKTFPGNR